MPALRHVKQKMTLMQALSVNSRARCTRLLPAGSSSAQARRGCCHRGQDCSGTPFLVQFCWYHGGQGRFSCWSVFFLPSQLKQKRCPGRRTCFSLIQISRCITEMWCWPGLWSWDLSWYFLQLTLLFRQNPNDRDPFCHAESSFSFPDLLFFPCLCVNRVHKQAPFCSWKTYHFQSMIESHVFTSSEEMHGRGE